MIERILVAIEYGDTFHYVFDQATELAQKIQANLNLLSVLSPKEDNSLTVSPYSDRDRATYQEKYQGIETANTRLLKNLADKATEMGIKAEFTQEIGNVGPAICQLAKTWSADLIIVGSHGRKGVSEMLLGSVSNYVVHHATCSVMVVHKPA
ncbi:universal stress protein [Sphaerothrix gracilis]|uniref:universal stress protein n=1 Tax=Sphaerothrix gracilis TaxID=3151835 RepID=UPI0031FD0A10